MGKDVEWDLTNPSSAPPAGFAQLRSWMLKGYAWKGVIIPDPCDDPTALIVSATPEDCDPTKWAVWHVGSYVPGKLMVDVVFKRTLPESRRQKRKEKEENSSV